jgi:hypothetical protein
MGFPWSSGGRASIKRCRERVSVSPDKLWGRRRRWIRDWDDGQQLERPGALSLHCGHDSHGRGGIGRFDVCRFAIAGSQVADVIAHGEENLSRARRSPRHLRNRRAVGATVGAWRAVRLVSQQKRQCAGDEMAVLAGSCANRDAIPKSFKRM